MRSPTYKVTWNKISGEPAWKALIRRKRTFPAQRILEASKVSSSGLQSTITSFSYNTIIKKIIYTTQSTLFTHGMNMVQLTQTHDADYVKHCLFLDT